MVKFNIEENQRKQRSDKKIRVNCSLDSQTHDMLKQLGIACNFTKSSMGAKLIEFCVRHPDVIRYFQESYNTNPKYKVTIAKQNGEIFYAD